MDEIAGQSQEPVIVKQEPLVRAVRSLTFAVWGVVIGILLWFVFFFVMTVWPAIGPVHRSVVVSGSTTPPSWQPEKFEGKNFGELTNEKKIKYASVVLLTKFVTTDGKTTNVIADIVRVKPGTDFHQKVGDELVVAGMFPVAGQVYGDGNLVLLVGTSAEMREASSYVGDRIGAGQDAMSLERVRELAKQEKK